MVLTDKEKYQSTLNNIMSLCERVLYVDDDNMRVQILTSCQEAVIALGNVLEQSHNVLDVRAIEELQIIKELETFCELLYQCSQDCNSRNVVLMKNSLTHISVALDAVPRTFRVVFLPYKASMWDSLESIWKEFEADERCETSVVPIPYFEANRKLNQWDTCYEGNMYPEDVPIVHFQDYLLGDKKPDLAFVHYPFDQHNNVTTVHPAYYSEELKKNCRKFVYVPYFVNPGFVSDDYNLLPLLYRADYLVLQSEQMKETCKDYPYYDRVLPFGSPKFDKVIRLCKENVAPPKEWSMDVTGKKKFLLNTTITDFLESGELLMNKLHRFFEVVAKRDDLVIIWRPHPLLEGTVKAMRPQFIEKYQELVDFFQDNYVGVLDKTADVSRSVAVCDAYIGSHYSSIIALFEVLNKPIFRFDSKKYYDVKDIPNRTRVKAEEVFGMNGPYDFFGCYESEEYLFDDFVDDFMNGGLVNVLKKQAEAEAGISNNLDGTCGEKVHEYLMKELLKA